MGNGYEKDVCQKLKINWSLSIFLFHSLLLHQIMFYLIAQILVAIKSTKGILRAELQVQKKIECFKTLKV